MIPEGKGVKPRPPSCAPDIGVVGSGEPCPHCGYYHLRPGYCQALDPQNPNYKGVKAVDTGEPVNSPEPVHAAPVNTKSVHKRQSVNTPPVHKAESVNTAPVHAESVNSSEEEKRKAYRREWMRKKRAANQS